MGHYRFLSACISGIFPYPNVLIKGRITEHSVSTNMLSSLDTTAVLMAPASPQNMFVMGLSIVMKEKMRKVVT